MLKNAAKLLIGAIVLLAVLAIVMGVLQMVNRSGVKRVIEDYERALCELRFDKARACCSEEGYLIRNGKKILFSDTSGFYAAAGKRKHGTNSEIQFETIDVAGENAVVHAVFTSSLKDEEPVAYKITLKRIKGEWKITSLDDGSEVVEKDAPAREAAPAEDNEAKAES